MCPQDVSAVETAFELKKGQKRRGLQTKRTRSLQVTGRDQLIREALETVGLLSAKQVQVLGFSLNNYTACKRRMTKLTRANVVARLPRHWVNEPYIYCLPKTKLKTRTLIEHNLGISELYVRVVRACSQLGYSLLDWQDPSSLQPLLSERTALAPDAFFKLQRTVRGEIRTSGFFLEYERTTRDASVLVHKLTRYADLLHSGGYRDLFGHRAMRVLVIYASEVSMPSQRKLQRALDVASRVGGTLARFITIESVTAAEPEALLTAPLWYRAGLDEPVRLFEQ